MQARIYEYFSQILAQNSAQICPQILITDDEKDSALCAEVLKFLGFKTFVLPDFRAHFGEDLRSYYDELIGISRSLGAYYKCEGRKILISPVRTILNKLPTKSQLKGIKIEFAQKLNLAEFKDEILRLGYSVTQVVESAGEISFRGEIIDIFPLGGECGVRVLLDDDEIESIRHFDIDTQKSEKIELESVEIEPFLANLNKGEFESANEKISAFDSDALINDLTSLGFWFIDGFADYLQEFSAVLACPIKKDEIFAERDLSVLDTLPLIPAARKFKDLQITPNSEFFEFHKNDKITIIARNDALLAHLDLSNLSNAKILKEDFILNLISSDEIIVSLNKLIPKKRVRKSSLALDELNPGDFVVHEDYGIAKFAGLELATVLGHSREFVALIYEGGDKLLLPVEYLNKIDKYIAGGGVVSPDRLGKASFAKIKEKVREKLFVIASKIIQTAAKRELIRGVMIENTGPNYAKFIASSGFSYTPDQESAISAILQDLRSGKVMDRLLSGDVGFGKTEVAMNAIFATIKSGFSALFFVPTTLLCAQHYATLKARFDEFEIPVFRLDRFSKAKEKSEILKRLKNNEAIVCVGTHSLLNVEAPNLGLVIVDEEHKFGVKQKEKLKEKSQNSHLLSMSATPIPRSLNMALSQIKSYSTLLTPPLDRLDVRTMVKEWDEKIVKEAITRELRRGGQIFYVHNHIASMPSVKKRLLEILPNLKIVILHSKIDAQTTEDEMAKFIAGEYDLMLCTSIVESGIHMPRVNTILIDNADKFGIADLHQLRGRVGRSNKQAFCYYLIGDKTALTSDALKRLVALESNSFLGSGSVLAYHDLEIRGGGNLVGEAQSGHIEAIGYSLYLRMLEDEINKLLNQKTIISSVELKISVNAFLNSEYIAEDRLRLDIYHRLSKCENAMQINEIYAEIEDRFGKADVYTKQFIDMMMIKVLAQNIGVRAISSADVNIVITDKNGEKIRLKSPSKDDDDVLAEILVYLRKENKNV
ncbi:helicase-related protein [Campylobacter sp. JMF_04 NA10]|uniref:DEAD/DEAH box helicase n=1 Tax=Campylobacter sp. JMF_04 NA10 TaxID=2983824 RepID=UPI0022E9BAB0|nr:DEAD/DEAH box helicase [Campylobacter sp. JMF_04 NA10]MDA3077112.1 helicase-related protein [Campylobacter sp. JMF_04 NA10]